MGLFGIMKIDFIIKVMIVLTFSLENVKICHTDHKSAIAWNDTKKGVYRVSIVKRPLLST